MAAAGITEEEATAVDIMGAVKQRIEAQARLQLPPFAARTQGRNEPEPIWRLPPCPSLADKRDQDLRDTAVTWLARAGATLPEIASITGHSLASIHAIMKHYLAMTPELGDAGIDKLIAWMEREGIAVN